jgi:hypothetical protein
MTPYDTALRVQRREVDALRLSISLELAQVATFEAQRIDHDRTGRDERAMAATQTFPSDAWARRMRSDRARLDEAAQLASARLTALRAQAGEADGTVRAIEIAADGFRNELERSAANAEQGSADDLAAAAFLRARRIRRRTA